MAKAPVSTKATPWEPNNGDRILVMPRIGGTFQMKIRVMD